jgi:ABC-type multidrug transport system fused ATPase/permease subunit
MFLRIGIVSIQMKTKIKHLDLSVMNHLNYLSIEKFFSFSNGQHINEHSGVKQNIVNVGTNSIKSQMDLVFFTLFPLLTQLVVALGILFYSSIFVGIIFLFIGILFCLMMARVNNKLVPGVRKIRDRAQINSRLIAELYRFVVSVKIESQEENSLINLTEVQQKHKTISIETWAPVVNSLFKIRSMTMSIRFIALALVVYLVFNKQFSLGAMFLVFTYSTQFLNGLWSFMDVHKQFLIDKINIEKYFEMLEVKSDIVIVDNPIGLDNLYGAIEFKNVSFYYPQRVSTYEDIQDEEMPQDDAVLKNVSFTIRGGEKVGIVGESGSGKSTLANLIRRSFDPQEGQILIDGNDLRLLDLKLYLEHVGNVEQEVVMFDRSIKDNILFGLNDKTKVISDEKLTRIAKIARIDAFFPRLEHGFNTIVGEKGVKLSGGERQRVGIARALAKEPSLLIFDEATSALDAVSERIVQESIDEACKGKTSIVIAHRLSTVKNCDRILVFRHGILLSEGTHDELLNDCEYYAELVYHQMVTI